MKTTGWHAIELSDFFYRECKMTTVDLLISAPHFLTMEGDGVGYRENHSMAIDRGKIVAIGKDGAVTSEYEAERHIRLDHHVVLPGLIDAHIHSSEAVFRGLAQDTKHWMMYGLEPFLKHLEPATAALGTRLALLEAVKAGTTTFGEFSRIPETLIPIFNKTGVRSQITVTIREALNRVYHPGELYEFDRAQGEMMFDHALDVFERYNHTSDGRVTVLLGPQGPDFLSEELLLKVKRAAGERGCRIHMHTQQGDRETAQLMMRYNKRPIAWLDEIGYLDEQLIAVHLTDADEDEATLVSKRGASMILCSGSIGIIDGIVPPAKVFQDAGGSVALGSDQASGNNNHNIFNEMKLTALFNKIRYQDPEIMPAWRVLRMATIEGAGVLGLDSRIGSLVTGKQADFIGIDLQRPSLSPVYSKPMRNIVPNLVYSGRGDEVSLAAVDGRIIYENGRLVGLDEDYTLQQVEKITDVLGDRATAEFWRINGKNARLMKKEKL